MRFGNVSLTASTSPISTPSVTIANTGSPAAGDIVQGTDDAVLFGFSLTPSASIDFTAVDIATSGTAASTDLSNFRLVHDANSNGAFDGGEDVVATVATLANPLVFGSFSPAQTGISAVRRYLLIADVAVDADEDVTFTASIADASDVTTTGDVSGTAAGNEQTVISASAPVITTSVGSLTSFGDVANGSVSGQQTFTVSGDNLTTGVTVTAPTHFEIALESDGVFDSEIVLPQTGGNLNGEPVTIYAQLNPASVAGSVSGNITLASTGATTANVAVSGFVLAAQPSTSASGLSFTSVTPTGFTINWTRGDGDSVLVVMKSGAAVDADPTDKSAYSANSVFGSGSQIGTGNYVVFKGVGTNVAITGLNGGTTYHVEIFEYNSSATAGTQNYQVTGLTGSQESGAPIADYVVIAEVYGGGGNSGAHWKHDYIVLYNPTESAVDVSSFSVQYASATGSTWAVNPLSGTIQSKSYYLIRLAGGSGGVDITNHQVTGTSNLSGTAGKVALVNSTVALSGTNPSNHSSVIDFVGFGATANGFEGTGPTLAPSNTTSVRRKSNFNTSEFGYFGSAWDANDNASDFYVHTIGSEIPRNGPQGLIVNGTAGWRMMSMPVSGVTVADLAAQNLVQGIAGGSYSAFAPNFYSNFSGLADGPNSDGWNIPANHSTTLNSGQGFIWYFYNNTNVAESKALPFTLSVTGTEPSSNVSVDLHTNGSGFNLVGNPFASSINVSSLSEVGGVFESAVVQVWDPSTAGGGGGTSSYVLSSSGTLDGKIAPFQAFLLENSTAEAVNIPTAAKTTGGTFLKDVSTRAIEFEMNGSGSVDKAAIVYFHPNAELTWDKWDASKLMPLSGSVGIMAFEGVRNGTDVVQAQKSLPYDLQVEVGVKIQFTASYAGDFTISWPVLRDIPENWSVVLVDHQTDIHTDLRTTESYSFSHDGAMTKAQPEGKSLPVVMSAAPTTPRFTLVIDPGTSTSVERGPETVGRMALHGAYPNPFNPSTVIGFTLDAPRATRLAVYDMLGRQVATLIDGNMPAGEHKVTFDAAGLGSGVYLVRLEAGGMSMTRRVTLVR